MGREEAVGRKRVRPWGVVCGGKSGEGRGCGVAQEVMGRGRCVWDKMCVEARVRGRGKEKELYNRVM